MARSSKRAAWLFSGRGCRGQDSAGGWSITELTVALAIAGLAFTLSLPPLLLSVQRQRLEGATRDLAQTMLAARWRAVASGAATGLRFTLPAPGELVWVVHRDGNGNGLRTAEMASGADPALSTPARLAWQAAGVHAGVLPGRTIPRLPPQTGALSNPADPVKFGAADVVSFKATGAATPGSLYLTDGRQMTALVINGVTGRLRLFRFEPDNNAWKEMH